jgi:ABC-type Mn2+/Zn2+ transport system permease subunit
MVSLLDILMEPFMIRAILGIVFSGLATLPVIFSNFKGLGYMPAEVSHAALAGAAVGIFLGSVLNIGIDPLIFALAFNLLTTLLIARAGEGAETERAGVVLGSILALSVAIYAFIKGLGSSEMAARIDGFLVSDLLLLTWNDIALLAFISIATLFSILLFRKEFTYIVFDPEGAAQLGLNVRFYTYFLFSLIAASGAVVARTMGALLVHAAIMPPAAIAALLTKRLDRMLLASFVIALAFGLAGLLISAVINLPSSGTIGLLSSLAYVVLLFFKSKQA